MHALHKHLKELAKQAKSYVAASGTLGEVSNALACELDGDWRDVNEPSSILSLTQAFHTLGEMLKEIQVRFWFFRASNRLIFGVFRWANFFGEQ